MKKDEKLTPAEKVTKSRVNMLLTEPFYSMIAMRLTCVEDPTCETAWTDGAHFGYNPEWLKPLTMDEMKTLWCHEVDHIIFLHHLRSGHRDHGKWNRAGDYAINLLLKDAGYHFTGNLKHGLLDEQYRGKYAEEIYNMLKDEDPQGGGGQGPQGDGSGQPGEGQGDPQPGQGDPGGMGEVRDMKNPDNSPMTETQKAVAERELKEVITQAIQVAKAAGKLPGNIKEMLDKILEPIIPWRQVLQEFVSGFSTNDYDMSRTSRRHLCSGVILPVLRRPELALIASAWDCSGSMNRDDLIDVMSEMKGMLMAYPDAEILMIQFDHAVQKVELVNQDTLIPECHGRGGTSFTAPIEYLEKSEHEPKALIILTDGGACDFPNDPGIPVLWVLTKELSTWKPPYGMTLTIGRDRR